MTNSLLWILIFGACLGGWALLAVLGAERQRMLDEREANRPPPPAASNAPGAKPSATRAGSKLRHAISSTPPAAPKSAPAAGAKRPPAAAANTR